MTDNLLRTAKGPGGLRAAALRLPARTTAAVIAGVPLGARDDPAGQEGLTHLLEHVLFRGGPEGDAEATSRAFARAGADANATTSHDDLRLDAIVLPDGLAAAARTIGGILHAPRLTNADIDHERQIVLQEIAEQPDEGGIGELLDAACWGTHPLARPIAGTRDSLLRISAAALRHIAHRHLGPSVTCAVAVGDADPDAMLHALLAAFGGPAGAQVPNRRRPVFQGGIKWIETNTEDPVADVALAWPAPPAGAKDADAARLAAAFLGGCPAAALFLSLRERNGLVYGVEARLEQGEDWGRLCIALSLPAKALTDGLAVLSETLDAPPESDRLAEIRRVETLRLAAVLDEPEGAAQALLSDLLGGRPPVSPAQRIARLRNIPDADVFQTLQRILAGPPALAILGPPPRRRALARTRFADLAQRLPR